MESRVVSIKSIRVFSSIFQRPLPIFVIIFWKCFNLCVERTSIDVGLCQQKENEQNERNNKKLMCKLGANWSAAPFGCEIYCC